MLMKKPSNRNVIEFVSLDAMVPENHLLRKIDAVIDFDAIYDIVKDLYCEDNGRPSIDPVVLFKIVLLQHIYGIPSLRRTLAEINMNMAYRWFLGYAINDAIPHFSTVSYNFKHRFTPETVEDIFQWVLNLAADGGCLDSYAVFIDGTHIKANANMRKKAKKIVPREAKRYTKQLQKEINEDREKHGKKPFDFDDNPPQEEKESTVSTTDPDSGVFVKGEHKRCFAYEAHTACNKYGIVLGVHVTAGNIHDSVAFEALYDILNVRFPDHALVVADSAYKTPAICKRIIDSGRVLLAPYTRPKGRKGGLRQRDFVHDEYFDDIICPAYRTLHYVTTNRDGYREYRSRPYICRDCELLSQCTANAKCEKTVVRHLWADYVEQTEEYRYTALHKKWYGRRKETIERVFADAKEKHAMRFTPYRGLAQVTNWVKLKFAAMNLKKLALWLTRKGENSPLFVQNLLRWLNFIENTKNPVLSCFKTGFFDSLERSHLQALLFYWRVKMTDFVRLLEPVTACTS